MDYCDTGWKDMVDDITNSIPTSLIAKLLVGEIDYSNTDSTRGNYCERGWRQHVRSRLGWPFIEQHLVYDDGYEGMARRLGASLLQIVYFHESIVNLSTAARGVLVEANVPISAGSISYLTGSGLCSEAASLGVAIARANDVEACIVGHPDYFGPGLKHYGVKLTSSDGEKSKIVLHRRWPERAVDMSQFREIPDCPAAKPTQ